MKDLKQIMPKKLGFGCMRLPVANGNSEEIDDVVFSRMIDRYMEQGFVYFDTAYPYHNQKSEEAVRRCLVERYDRERFLLADKMPVWLVQNTEDYSEIFERQLARCGVTYFDFYLLHPMNKTRVEETEKTNEDGRAHPPYRIFVPRYGRSARGDPEKSPGDGVCAASDQLL